jgi:DNA-binding transcriptional regulator YiaG
MGQIAKRLGGRDSYSDDLLRHVDPDGAEYFTVKATGQSGMSHSGLARFLGVRRQRISKWVKRVQEANPTENSLPKCLKPFAGHNLILTEYFDIEGRNIMADGFCAAMIEYYASYSRQVNKESQTKAKQTLDLIKHLGMRLFIHKKTGWRSNNCSSSSVEDNFELEFEKHRVRFSVRQILKLDDYPELRSAIKEYGQKHNCLCRKLFSETHDAMNKLLQGLKASEIRQHNNLSRSVSLRDHYDTRPLIDYSTISRLTANQIRDEDKHPVEAVHIAFKLLLPRHIPQPLPIIENVNKADMRLRKVARQKQLAAGVQLSFLTDDLEIKPQLL